VPTRFLVWFGRLVGWGRAPELFQRLLDRPRQLPVPHRGLAAKAVSEGADESDTGVRGQRSTSVEKSVPLLIAKHNRRHLGSPCSIVAAHILRFWQCTLPWLMPGLFLCSPTAPRRGLIIFLYW
jgi:hypothetical protein